MILAYLHLLKLSFGVFFPNYCKLQSPFHNFGRIYLVTCRDGVSSTPTYAHTYVDLDGNKTVNEETFFDDGTDVSYKTLTDKKIINYFKRLFFI